MTYSNLNYIAGEWLKGQAEVENRNPSDTRDLIGLYAQASSQQLETAIELLKKQIQEDPFTFPGKPPYSKR